MKKLKIDLDLLMDSFSINDDELAKEYLDTNTGDILHIPCEVKRVAEGNGEEEDLADWEKDLLEEAYAIEEDEEDRYIMLPHIEDSYFYDAMVKFIRERVTSEELKEKLSAALSKSQPMRSFKSIIFNYEEELDKWQDYEEEKTKEYVISWLKDIGIEVE